MKTPIDLLMQMAQQYNDPVAMQISDERGFEKLFGGVYLAMKQIYSMPYSGRTYEQCITAAYQLLTTAITHHQKPGVTATPEAIRNYELAVKMMLDIVSRDFGVTESTYQSDVDTKKMLDALKACDIYPNGHERPRYSRNASDDSATKAEAIRFAQENIVRFAQFAYARGESKDYIPDPFFTGTRREDLLLYEKVKSLESTKLLELRASLESGKS